MFVTNIEGAHTAETVKDHIPYGKYSVRAHNLRLIKET